MDLIWLLLLCPVAYFVGNINFSILYTRFVRKKDIRTEGSGNAGATNMLRTYGFKIAMVFLALDILKGVGSALAGLLIFGEIGMYAMGLSAAFGHCFPVMFKFRGGKGFATMFGVFAVASPIAAAVVFVIGFTIMVMFEYGAVVSFLVMVSMVPWLMAHTDSLTASILLVGFFVLFSFMHRQNIVSLLAGRERRARTLRKLHAKRLRKRQDVWAAEIIG